MKINNRTLIILLIVAFIGQNLSAQKSNKNLESLIKRYQNIGINDKSKNWPQIDNKLLAEAKKEIVSIQKELGKVVINKSNEQELINYDLLKICVEDAVAEYNWDAYLIPLNAEGGFISNIIYTINRNEVKTSRDAVRYITKLKEFKNYTNYIQDLLLQGITAGKVSPKVIVSRCIGLIDYQIKDTVEQSLFFGPVANSSDSLQNAVKEIILNEVYPAYKTLKTYLATTYMDAAPERPGVGFLPDGKLFYENKIRYYTTLDMTPEEVFDTGSQEVTRIKAEMLDIVKGLNFQGSFEDFLLFLRTDKQFYPTSPQQLLHYAAWLGKTIEGKLPKYFNTLPRNPYTITPVPDALAPNYTAGRYSGGSYTGKRAGEYWVNTYNLSSRPFYAMPSLTLHEAVPGHHLQGSLAQEIKNMGTFRRNTYLSAFGEGWALYTEYLGKEMGMYTTPYEDFGRLTYEMWRACRLVVDVGLHYKGWSRDEAVAFMAGNTALSMHEVNSEIDRYIGWPGQAVSYKIGELTIRRLRTELEKRDGDKFDLATFHDNLLKNGSMPLKTLEYLVMQRMSHAKLE